MKDKPPTPPPTALSKLVGASTPDHAHSATWAASILRESMMRGVLTPGTKLPESQLAKELGISRNTLRQAFTTLEADHLVTRLPNRGVFVATPDSKQIKELFTLRLALEGAAVDRASSGKKPRLRYIIKESEIHRRNGSVVGMASSNQDFHRELVALAGSPRLDALMAGALAEMRLLFHSMTTVPDFHAPFVEKNAQLLHLVETGQTSSARDYLLNYLTESAAYFAGRI